MLELPESIRKKLTLLSDNFAEGLPERLHKIGSFLDSILSGDTSMKLLEDIRNEAHKLKGSAATFEMDEISDIASRFEEVIKDIIENHGDCSEDQVLLLQSLFSELNETSLPVIPENNTITPPPHMSHNAVQNGDEYEEVKNIHFYTECLPDVPGDMKTQLGFFGYTVTPVVSLDNVRKDLQNRSQYVLMIHTRCLAESEETVHTLEELKREFYSYLLVIFISDETDFDTRLKSVRAGGDAFFQLPLDVARLVTKIDRSTNRQAREPYHVLIVDDDPDQVAYYALLLQQSGMITSVATDPRQVIKVLIEAKPDLLLVDMYMPGCNGLELASIIRQQEAFVSIPIVFISVEKDLDRQMAAIRTGGDDFLTKPIRDEHLIAAITSRAERTRNLRYLMERDSLTGLLNHSNLKEQLLRELKRAGRSGETVCFAMIDLDHFKKVNDTYGHLTGDRVIKSLAQILYERLRSTDIIGRYGGEEFGVIMTNTNVDDARKVIDSIRGSFARIEQKVNDDIFHVTFSCGIAAYPDYSEAAAVNEAADKALYLAKEQGRDRVVVNYSD